MKAHAHVIIIIIMLIECLSCVWQAQCMNLHACLTSHHYVSERACNHPPPRVVPVAEVWLELRFFDSRGWFLPTTFLTLTELPLTCGYWTTGAPVHCWQECKMVYPLWKTVWWFLTKLNILLPYNPAIKLLSIYPHGFKTFVHARTCMWIFIAALFIIAKAWKQPSCPSVGR